MRLWTETGRALWEEFHRTMVIGIRTAEKRKDLSGIAAAAEGDTVIIIGEAATVAGAVGDDRRRGCEAATSASTTHDNRKKGLPRTGPRPTSQRGSCRN